MPNELDKILNEKLKDYQASYSPADWQAMEAMLPRDARKFFLAVVSLFGLLFLFTGTLMLNNLFHSSGAGKSSSMAEPLKGGALEADYGGLKYVPPLKAESRSLRQPVSGQTIVNNNAGSKALNGLSASRLNDSRSAQPGVVMLGKNNTQRQASEEEKVSGKKNEEAARHRAFSPRTRGRKQKDSANKSHNPVSGETIMPDQSAEMLARQNTQLIQADVNDYARILSLERIESVNTKKRRVFQFTLGAGAGPLISFIGTGSLTKPGYTAGLMQEFMFLKRIGLVLTEAYTLRKYDGGNYPCPAGYINCPSSYTSQIQSVDCGIDLKANLIHRAKWSWYAKAGITHVLKVKEIFKFTYTDIDTIAPPPRQSTQTNFTSAPAPEFDSAVLGVPNALAPHREPLPDLTISGDKRFHPAYHFATGLDVSLNARLKMQLEAGYSFTQPIVGDNDRRLHTPGCSGTIFCVFGK